MSGGREVVLFNVDGGDGDGAVVRVVRSAGLRSNGYDTPATVQILFRKLEILCPEFDAEGEYRTTSRVAFFSPEDIRTLREACDRALSEEVPA